MEEGRKWRRMVKLLALLSRFDFLKVLGHSEFNPCVWASCSRSKVQCSSELQNEYDACWMGCITGEKGTCLLSTLVYFTRRRWVGGHLCFYPKILLCSRSTEVGGTPQTPRVFCVYAGCLWYVYSVFLVHIFGVPGAYIGCLWCV